MLNMGFKDDVETMLNAASCEGRQTLLFSATHPPWVRSVARTYLHQPVTIDATGAGNTEANMDVEHRAVLTPAAEASRSGTLADVIAVYGTPETRTIVFTATKRECDELCASGPLAPLSPQALHGDVSQNQREVTMKKFREGHFNVLVATDVAARGIDVSGVDLIVQYRIPQDPDSYVHRAGRTGRAGRSGVSILLYTEREARELRGLEGRTGVKFARAGPPSAATVMKAAAQLVPKRISMVDPAVRRYFEDAATSLLADERATDKVAAALALVAGKISLAQRSLLTGEDGVVTLQLEASDGSPLAPGDAMAAVASVGASADGQRAADHVGKIRACHLPSRLVFDLPAEMAHTLVESFAATSPSPAEAGSDPEGGSAGGVGSSEPSPATPSSPYGARAQGSPRPPRPGGGRSNLLAEGVLSLAVCEELPPLRTDFDRGRGGGRGGGGGGYGRGGGGFRGRGRYGGRGGGGYGGGGYGGGGGGGYGGGGGGGGGGYRGGGGGYRGGTSRPGTARPDRGGFRPVHGDRPHQGGGRSGSGWTGGGGGAAGGRGGRVGRFGD